MVNYVSRPKGIIMTGAFVGIVVLLAPTSVWGDQSLKNVGPRSFYTIAAGTCTGCKPLVSRLPIFTRA